MAAPARTRNRRQNKLPSRRELQRRFVSRAKPLNLLNLAKTELGTSKSALEHDLSVQALTEPLTLSPAKLWVLVLEGSLIVDLPHGDFYTLKVGDSVHLDAEQVTLTPLQNAVFLFAETVAESKPSGLPERQNRGQAVAERLF